MNFLFTLCELCELFVNFAGQVTTSTVTYNDADVSNASDTIKRILTSLSPMGTASPGLGLLL